MAQPWMSQLNWNSQPWDRCSSCQVKGMPRKWDLSMKHSQWYEGSAAQTKPQEVLKRYWIYIGMRMETSHKVDWVTVQVNECSECCLQGSQGPPGKPHFGTDQTQKHQIPYPLIPSKCSKHWVNRFTGRKSPLSSFALAGPVNSGFIMFSGGEQWLDHRGALLLEHRVVQSIWRQLSRVFLNVPVNTFCTKAPTWKSSFPENQARGHSLRCGFHSQSNCIRFG